AHVGPRSTVSGLSSSSMRSARPDSCPSARRPGCMVDIQLFLMLAFPALNRMNQHDSAKNVHQNADAMQDQARFEDGSSFRPRRPSSKFKTSTATVRREGGGLGEAAARHLSNRGAKVVLAARRAD